MAIIEDIVDVTSGFTNSVSGSINIVVDHNHPLIPILPMVLARCQLKIVDMDGEL